MFSRLLIHYTSASSKPKVRLRGFEDALGVCLRQSTCVFGGR